MFFGNFISSKIILVVFSLLLGLAVICVSYFCGRSQGQALADEACRLRAEALAARHASELAQLQAAAVEELERREYELHVEQQREADKLRRRAERAERLLRDLRARYDADAETNPVGPGCNLPVSRLQIVNEARRCWSGINPAGCDAVRSEVF